MIDRSEFRAIKPTQTKTKEVSLTKDHEHFLTLMLDNDIPLPHTETKAFKTIIKHLSKLKGGSLFNDEVSFSKWHRHPFSKDEIEEGIINFASARNDESVEPENKKWLKVVSTDRLFYAPYSTGIGKSPFLFFLENPPKLKIQEINPTITKRLIGRFTREVNPLNGDRKNFIEAGNRCINFYNTYKKEFRLPSDPLIVSDWLLESLMKSWAATKGRAILPSYLNSDLTWREILPQYLIKQGVWRDSVKIYGVKS